MPRPGAALMRALRLVLGLALAAAPLAAQDEATVATLGRILAAEDQRRVDDPVLVEAVNDPDPLVRRSAALALGRFGWPDKASLLQPLLEDPDSTVQAAALFALGLMRDSSLAPMVVERLTAGRPVATIAAQEGVLALARLGGRPAAELMGSILRGTARLTVPDTLAVLREAAWQAWRLGPRAPGASLLPLIDHEDRLVVEGAAFSAGRLRLPEALPRLLDLMRHPEPSVRELASRGVSGPAADSAGMGRSTVASLLLRGLDDDQAAVRINVLRALGSMGDTAVADRVAAALRDRDPNVRVQAAATLGRIGTAAEVPALAAMAQDGERWAQRREALLALAGLDTAAMAAAAGRWSASAEWRDRLVAAQAWGRVDPDAPALLRLARDSDPRVAAGALAAATPAEGAASAEVLALAREQLYARDFMQRAAAAGAVGTAPTAGDVPGLVSVLRGSVRDSSPDAAWAALGALRQVTRLRVGDGLAAVVGAVPRTDDPLWTGWAAREWPELSTAWGGAWPVRVGRGDEEYRELARRFVANRTETAFPRVRIEVVERGDLELELFGPDAPLTVANFLRLVDQRAFDGGTWHRVVPNFVVQDGDPRGDGSGGPGWSIRDEINQRRYDARGVVGMALAGPDTGGSQWFITLSPQPHLDGGYTVFGRLVGNQGALARITQGDVIRTIRR